MNYDELQKLINGYQSDMLEVLETLVSHESPSMDKPALDSFARIIFERFRSLGAEVSILDQSNRGDHVEVVLRPSQAGSHRPALILCHYDTVWSLGTIEGRPFNILGDMAYGPGVYDMKASLVMLEFALRGIAELGLPLARPLILLFTSDEEIGSRSSRELIENHARQSEFVLVLEPPTEEGFLKTGRKGVGAFTLQVEGRAAHAGSQPEKGISAITELAHQILGLQGLANDELGTTINVGVAEGGTRTNVIPSQAMAKIDVRAWTPQEAKRVEEAIKNLQPILPGTKFTISGGFGRPPMVRTEAIAELFRKAALIGEKLGLALEEGSTGGGSDGNFTAALGVPTLDGLGAMGDGAHADYEHILVSHLPSRTALLAALLLQL